MSNSKKMTVIKGFLSLKNGEILKKSIYHYNFKIFKFLNKKYFYTKNVNEIFKSFYLTYQRNCYKNWNI